MTIDEILADLDDIDSALQPFEDDFINIGGNSFPPFRPADGDLGHQMKRIIADIKELIAIVKIKNNA